MRFVALPLALLAAACAPDQGLNYSKNDPVVIEDGAITGRVCDPSGRTWLADAQAYVKRLEQLVGAPIKMVSVGPERTATLIR